MVRAHWRCFECAHQAMHSLPRFYFSAVDLPTDWEGRFFRTPARKVLWVFLQPAFYGLRPLLVNPKPLAPWELFNVAVQLAFDAVICWSFGLQAGVYLLLSTLLGMGLHPTAYHFISEVRAC